MPLILLLVGGILIVAAYNDAVGGLASELETDIPGFLKWALAVGCVGAIGWVPGAQTISRWILGLVLLVLFISNNSAIVAGFKALSGAAGSATATAAGGSTTPAAQYIANPASPQITQAAIYGDVGVPAGMGTGSSSAEAVNINAAAQTPSIAVSPYDPEALLAGFEAGFGGIV